MMKTGGTVARGLYGSRVPQPLGIVMNRKNVIINSWHDTLDTRARDTRPTHTHVASSTADTAQVHT